MLVQLADSEGIYLELSALAGMYGPVMKRSHPAFTQYHDLTNVTHLVWATGGSMVPTGEMAHYYETGKRLSKN
jgi:D-serine dehydratase